jgi:hypothetical protein
MMFFASQDHVSRSELGFFWQHLHPVLANLHTQRVAAQQENAPIRARAILALLEQVCVCAFFISLFCVADVLVSISSNVTLLCISCVTKIDHCP